MKGNLAATMLRWGLAFVFFYSAIQELVHPSSNTFVIPILLSAFSAYEFLLAAWLFWGKKLAWSSMIAAITLAANIIFVLVTTGTFTLSFRNVGLAMAALALFELSREKTFKEEEE